MRVCRFVAVVILVFIPTILSSQSSGARETSWQWQGNCPGDKKLQILVSIDGKTIFQSDFAICQIRHDSKATVSPQKNLVFSIKGGHAFQKQFLTSPNEMIRGDIWLAGSDAGDLLLGISFMDDKQILLNTIHIAKPDRESRTEIDPGMVVRTVPLDHK